MKEIHRFPIDFRVTKNRCQFFLVFFSCLTCYFSNTREWYHQPEKLSSLVIIPGVINSGVIIPGVITSGVITPGVITTGVITPGVVIPGVIT